MAVDPNIKVLDLYLAVADPRLEVVDLKQEVPERRSGGIRPNLTPDDISRKSPEVLVKRSPTVVRKERSLGLIAPWDSTAIV